MRGFTLLEVMVALAIMAAVVLTLLGSVNYHLNFLASERDTTALTLLARARFVELEQQTGLPQKSEGTFAPLHPDIIWHAELFTTQYPSLQKLVLKVKRGDDRREVVLVRYILK